HPSPTLASTPPLHDALPISLVASFEIAAVTMVVATVLGTFLAFGLVRARGRIGNTSNILMLLPLITPEIVTAVGLLLLFGQVKIDRKSTRLNSSHQIISYAV